jgi:hypothetical protein
MVSATNVILFFVNITSSCGENKQNSDQLSLIAIRQLNLDADELLTLC